MHGFVRENGDQEGKITVKSDQENNIQCLVEDVVQRRPEGRTVVRNARGVAKEAVAMSRGWFSRWRDRSGRCG